MNHARAIRFSIVLLSMLFFASGWVMTSSAFGQGQEIRELKTAVKKAQQMLSDGKQKELVQYIPVFQEKFETLAKGGPNVIKNLESVHDDFKKIYSELELAGFTLPAWKDLAPTTPGEGGGGGFVKDVAPILVAKCGRCHVDRASGRVSLKSYTDIMAAQGGLAIFPGKAAESQLIDIIESGEMPKGGLKVSDEELATLKKWIDDGAKFDGENRNELLTVFAPKSDAGNMPEAEVKKSTGKETVSFAIDIAPVLIANCTGCHINAQNVRGGLNMNTFELLVRGGDGGAIFMAGKPAESALVQRIKSTGNDRMPQGRDPLKAEVIAKIEKWIEEGATFDGGDPKDALQTVYAVAKATRSTHEELMTERIQQSLDNWRLGMPNIENKQAETENFLVIGNVPEEQLKAIGKEAEQIAPQVARTFRDSSSKDPLVKGRITLFVFNKRYDYSEFGKMVEQRTLPKEWRGHWRYDVVNAYVAILPEDQTKNEALLARQIAGVYVSSLGKEVPQWFAEGAARVAAARADKRDATVLSWEDGVSAAMAKMTGPDDFLTGKMSTEDAELIAYKFVDSLMSDSRRFGQLLSALRKGNSFEQSFAAVYGGTPSQVATNWLGGKRK
jgi:hypothetical protein